MTFREKYAEIAATIFISVVLAGITGYFSARIGIERELSGLRSQLVELRTSAVSTYQPAANSVQEHQIKLIGIENDIRSLNIRGDQMDQIIEIYKEQIRFELSRVRDETIVALNKFLQLVRHEGATVPTTDP